MIKKLWKSASLNKDRNQAKATSLDMDVMDSTQQKINLRIPQQTLNTLSFAEGSEKGITRWLENLPKANIGETARQLYQGLIELNQLDVAPDTRLLMLEKIRQEVHYVCNALSKYYLGQSIVLSDKPRKVANLSQALQNHLANGYKIVVAQEKALKSRDYNEQMALAVQRAMRGLCGPLLRAYQLYCPVADGVWLELHQLYQLARRRKLHQQKVADKEAIDGKTMTIEQAYLTALLMGSARPNQMRQSAMARLFSILEDWSRHAQLLPASDGRGLFIINPEMDCPPRYRSLISEEDLSESLAMDTSALVDGLKDYMLNGGENRGPLKVPDNLGIELLQHLSQSWGDLAERTFNRVPGRGKLRVCIGMSATHFRIAKTSFANFIDADDHEINPFSDAARRNKQEGWDGPNTLDGDQTVDWVPASAKVEEINYSDSPSGIDEEDDNDYPVHSLPIINHSPGGFCLTWPKDVPKQLQAGELLCTQEDNDNSWSLAVVRWIRQVRGGGTQMGIELVAPHCTPCAIKLLPKSGEPSQYLRGLMLPEVTAIDRPATLITPRMPFQINSKIMLLAGGKESRAHLVDRITATGSFSQFEYRVLEDEAGKPGTKAEASKPGAGSGLSLVSEDDFDSLWKSL